MVSVVILSQNNCDDLIGDLNRQTYKDFEIIMANEKGIVNALNIALDKAKGDIFVRLDDDVVLPPKWLESLIAPFLNPAIAGVTGPTFVLYALRKNRDSIRIANNPNRFLRWMFDNDPYAPAKIYKCGSVSYGSNFIDKMNRQEYYDIDHLEGTNWAMRTNLIRQVGGFDPAFTGVCEWVDTDVEFKIKKLGYKLFYSKKAVVWHMLSKGEHYENRFEGMSRLKNYLLFHKRHSRFHYKMILWVTMMIGYLIYKRWQHS